MDNVIYADFDQGDDGSGYLLEDAKDGMKRVTGVYVGDIASASKGDSVMLGTKIENGIGYPVFTSMKEMNQFCIMWLCIFQPEVIVKGHPPQGE